MIKSIIYVIASLLGVQEAYRPFVDEGILDFSGQGRNMYGG